MYRTDKQEAVLWGWGRWGCGGESGVVGAYMRGLRLGIFSVPLLHSLPPNNLKPSGQVAPFCHQCTDFTLKSYWKNFLLEFTENLLEDSQQTLNIFF